MIVGRFLLILFLEKCDSFLEGISGLFKIIHEGCYPFESKNSPHISSIRVFSNVFCIWSETFGITALLHEFGGRVG